MCINVPILSKRCEWVVHTILFVNDILHCRCFIRLWNNLSFASNWVQFRLFMGPCYLFFLDFLCCFILPSSCVLCPMLLVSLDCPFVTTPVVFFNVNCRMRVHKTTNILLEKPTRVYVIRSPFLSFSVGFSCCFSLLCNNSTRRFTFVREWLLFSAAIVST